MALLILSHKSNHKNFLTVIDLREYVILFSWIQERFKESRRSKASLVQVLIVSLRP